MAEQAAFGALSAVAECGLSVPRDISLVGYNDIPLASGLPVPLTSVSAPFDQVAQAAPRLLLDDTPDTPVQRFSPMLIPRASSRTPDTSSNTGKPSYRRL
ncbi:substrate-binding domain-containing protein [Loktanella sp. S4079]|uniref:substrate-binding domain-containing protein n=1 Tax=Loktanella sp. S4079 TaxID=579483 RepID=UPI000ACA528D|nr:substrate-binding domain-containing protein [Loktanella sp. S4079]